MSWTKKYGTKLLGTVVTNPLMFVEVATVIVLMEQLIIVRTVDAQKLTTEHCIHVEDVLKNASSLL